MICPKYVATTCTLIIMVTLTLSSASVQVQRPLEPHDGKTAFQNAVHKIQKLNEATDMFVETISPSIDRWYPFALYQRMMKGEKVTKDQLMIAALRLVAPYSFEIEEFDSTEVVSIRVRQSRGENYRICLRGKKQKSSSERDFQVTLWIPIAEPTDSKKVTLLYV